MVSGVALDDVHVCRGRCDLIPCLCDLIHDAHSDLAATVWVMNDDDLDDGGVFG